MESTTPLPTSSYVILGCIETCGPMTSYELKKAVDESIGYFWDFPRAQLYVDPERLVALGLLTEEREAEGRRRRTYSITEAGREHLHAWLRNGEAPPVELRDMGLLKLHFGTLLDRDGIIRLAQAHAAEHRSRLAAYESILQEISTMPDERYSLATLRMGLAYEHAAIAFWESIAVQPPEP
jgi:PadR family transcriptional regulator, regulatory protein AphA